MGLSSFFYHKDMFILSHYNILIDNLFHLGIKNIDD